MVPFMGTLWVGKVARKVPFMGTLWVGKVARKVGTCLLRRPRLPNTMRRAIIDNTSLSMSASAALIL